MGVGSWLGRLLEDESSRRLRIAREERDRLRVEFEAKQHQVVQESIWGYGGGDSIYAPILDRLAEFQRDPTLFGFGGSFSRQGGQNWPLFQNEQQLNHYRAISRGVYEGNGHCKGLLGGLCSYVIHKGMTLRATTKEKQSDRVDALVSQTQDWLDQFESDNLFREKQQEVFSRSKRDGEAFLRLFFRPDGRTVIRFVWPENVYSPNQNNSDEWSFGILNREGDIQSVIAYAVWDDQGSQYSEVPAVHIEHFKCNVDSEVKRGLPEFILDVRDLMENARKLRRNTAQGAAIQAAIAWVRQHEQATISQVQQLSQANKDFQPPRLSMFGRNQIDAENFEPGTVLDIDKGTSYVSPPGTSNASNHIAVIQLLLRLSGARWNAPEGLASGDYSNNNFASSLVAESPFRRRMEMEQEWYKSRFHRMVEKARRHAIAVGLLPAESLQLVQIQVEPCALEAKDPSQLAQQNQMYLSMRIKSPQTISQELGLDYENEQTNIEAAMAAQGSQGAALPLPDQMGMGGGQAMDQMPQDDGMGGESPPFEQRYFEQWQYEFLTHEAREGLVLKEVQTKSGKTVKRWVRPGRDEQVAASKERGEEFRKEHDGRNPKDELKFQKEKAKPTREAAHATLKGLIDDRSKIADMTPSELAAHISHLTRDELRSYAGRYAKKIGGTKAELAQRIAEAALEGRPAAEPKAAKMSEDATPGTQPDGFSDLLSKIKSGSAGTPEIEAYLAGIQSLPRAEIDQVLAKAGIAGKAKSKGDAIDRLRMVLRQQNEMEIKSRRFQSDNKPNNTAPEAEAASFIDVNDGSAPKKQTPPQQKPGPVALRSMQSASDPDLPLKDRLAKLGSIDTSLLDQLMERFPREWREAGLGNNEFFRRLGGVHSDALKDNPSVPKLTAEIEGVLGRGEKLVAFLRKKHAEGAPANFGASEPADLAAMADFYESQLKTVSEEVRSTFAAPPAVGTTPKIEEQFRLTWDRMRHLSESVNGMVPMHLMFREAKKRIPGLTVEQFHKHMDDLWSQGKLQMHILNEVHSAPEQDKGMRKGSNFYYYALWNEGKK